MEDIKVLNGLMYDSLTTVFLSYKLLLKNNFELMLAYLNQANTFFTNAKTIYYSGKGTYKCEKTEQILYKFGKINETVLKTVAVYKNSSMEDIKILFEELSQLISFSKYHK